MGLMYLPLERYANLNISAPGAEPYVTCLHISINHISINYAL